MSKTLTNKPFAAAAEQNKNAILPVLTAELSAGDQVLEIGSGTGQHVCYFAEHLPDVVWQPSDLIVNLDAIRLWSQESQSNNILPPIELDVCAKPWPDVRANFVYSANTFHIVSWHAIDSIYAGCKHVLNTGDKLCVYGPFKIAGEYTARSNEQFDQMLRANDPHSGVRDTNELNALACNHGFKQARLTALPSNNFIAIWERS